MMLRHNHRSLNQEIKHIYHVEPEIKSWDFNMFSNHHDSGWFYIKTWAYKYQEHHVR